MSAKQTTAKKQDKSPKSGTRAAGNSKIQGAKEESLGGVEPLRRGKKVGSSDVMNISLKLLKDIIPNDGTVIPIRRKWVEQYCTMNGIEITRFEPAKTKVVGEESSPGDAEVRDRVDLVEEVL